MKELKDEELQSRREFFKKAAKAALPVVGAVVLANIPNVLQASEAETSNCQGCAYTCAGSCAGYCDGECKGYCKRSCYGTCENTCHGSCSGGCATQAYA